MDAPYVQPQIAFTNIRQFPQQLSTAGEHSNRGVNVIGDAGG
jgi:hypothetical protein